MRDLVWDAVGTAVLFGLLFAFIFVGHGVGF